MNPTLLLIRTRARKTFGGAVRNWRGNLLGWAISLLVTAGLLAVFVFLFSGFSEGFAAAGLRAELLSIVFFLVAGYQVFADMKFLSDCVLGAEEGEILRPLPVPERARLLSGLTVAYLRSALSDALLLLPALLSYGILLECGAGFYLGILPVLLYVPLVAMLFAMLLHPVYLALRRFFSGRGVLLFVLALAGGAAVFFLYSRLLVIVDQLLANNRLQYLFRESNARIVRIAAECLVPVNFAAKALAGNAALFAPLTAAAGVGCAFGIYFLARAQARRAFCRPETLRTGSRTGRAGRPARSVFGALLRKEFRSITDRRGGLFVYWICIVMLPLFSYLSYSVLDSVLVQFGIRDYSFPFLFLMLALFSLMINTFAGGSLARDERTVYKTLPVSYRLQLGAKLVIPMGATVLSLAATGLLLSLTGLETASGAAAWLASGAALLLSLAVILFGLNREIGSAENPENAMSFGILSGLLLALLLSAGALALLLFAGGSAMLLFLFGASAALLALAAGLFFRRLEQRVKEA